MTVLTDGVLMDSDGDEEQDEEYLEEENEEENEHMVEDIEVGRNPSFTSLNTVLKLCLTIFCTKNFGLIRNFPSHSKLV